MQLRTAAPPSAACICPFGDRRSGSAGGQDGSWVGAPAGGGGGQAVEEPQQDLSRHLAVHLQRPLVALKEGSQLGFAALRLAATQQGE
jgi:hypothetical protein